MPDPPNQEIRRTLGRPACRGAQILEWKDAEGSPRYACVITPPGVETRAPLPLVVFFHDPQADPTAVDKETGLRKLAATFSVLMALPLESLFQVGFVVALGLLADTFLVRALLVPSLAVLLGERNWWPGSAAT